MSPSIGVNLRVTGSCSQGGRKYMEDMFTVAYQQTNDNKDLEYAYFGIFDGHGGHEAAKYCKEHLMDAITKNKLFWSEDDDSVLKAIREGFLSTQQAMWNELPNWRKTATGLPSTAGTTASICFIKRGKLFIGHVGDSGIILGERDPTHPSRWRAKPLTREHKPESETELARIEAAGGKVMSKAGVHRVVWYRPSNGALHQGPVRRSTNFDEVPFLAVARALGDLWSYNSEQDEFIVSPDPDLRVFDLNVLKDRCLVLATDGAWNVLSPEMAIEEVFAAERNNEKHMIDPQGGHTWINPSKKIVDIALDRWKNFKLRADNTSIVTVMLDPPGPPRAQVLRRLYGVQSEESTQLAKQTQSTGPTVPQHKSNTNENFPEHRQTRREEEPILSSLIQNKGPSSNTKYNSYSGNAESNNHIPEPNSKNTGTDMENLEELHGGPVSVVSRFPNPKQDENQVIHNTAKDLTTANPRNIQCVDGAVPDSNKTLTSQTKACQPSAQSYLSQPPPLPRSLHRNYMPKEHPSSLGSNKLPNRAAIDINSEIEEQTPSSTSNLNNQQRNIAEEKLQASIAKISPPVQINQVTSSDDETTPPPLPQRPPGGHGAINKRRTLCRELLDLQNNAFSMTPGACGDASRKTIVAKTKMPSDYCNKGRNTRSGYGANIITQNVVNSIGGRSGVSLPFHQMDESAIARNVSNQASKKSQRPITMPSEEGLDSAAYNSDTENHQPVAYQQKSRASRRSTSVPQSRSTGNIGDTTRNPRASSNDNRMKSGAPGLGPRTTATSSGTKCSLNNGPSNMEYQMAVNSNQPNTRLSQQPPPLPIRTALRSSASHHRVLQSTSVENETKSTPVSKSSANATEHSPKNQSPRILRSRNTPSGNNRIHNPIFVESSKVISTPQNRIPLKASGKSVPSKITSRTVQFFEENIKNANETSNKRKRRSFDTTGHTVPISKSAKLLRTAQSTRSCTWNNPNASSKPKPIISNSLYPRKSPTSSCKPTQITRKGPKN